MNVMPAMQRDLTAIAPARARVGLQPLNSLGQFLTSHVLQ